MLVDEDFTDPIHPEYQRFGAGHDDDHGVDMVDADRMGELLHGAGLVDVEAGKRQLADRPVLAVTGRAPG